MPASRCAVMASDADAPSSSVCVRASSASATSRTSPTLSPICFIVARMDSSKVAAAAMLDCIAFMASCCCWMVACCCSSISC